MRKLRDAGQLELIITVALGLAAIGGAYAAYRNEQRNHEATVQFSEGIKNFDEAGQFYSTANSTLTRDEAQFLAYTTAIHQHNRALATYILGSVMTPALQAGVRWWLSPANTSQPTPATTPFSPKDPNYSVPQLSKAVERTGASEANFTAARDRQDDADHFTLIEVILATALFLYGIAGVTRNMTVKLGALAIGATIFLISLGLAITG